MKQENDIHLAIIMTVHNRKAKTLKCLKYLSEQKNNEKIRIEVFLVDDGSTDGTSDEVIMKFPEVNIVKGNGDLYWNRGMNLAWKEAVKINPDFYLWLNDDTFMKEYCIEKMLNYSEQKENKSIIVSRTRSSFTGELTYGANKIVKDIESIEVLPSSNDLEECDMINGNCVLIPQTVFNQVGILDDIFIHAIGDFDYSLRAKKIGIKSFVISEALAYCEGHDALPLWCQSQVPIMKRLSNLYSPLANSHPILYYIFVKRHFGLEKAIRSFVLIHLRALYPALWKLKRVK